MLSPDGVRRRARAREGTAADVRRDAAQGEGRPRHRRARASATTTSRSSAPTASGRTSSGEIEPTEAAVVRRIFELSAAGHGVKAIAKILNAEGAPSPRAQRGRSQTWAPTSVRAVLYRPLYRGEIVWNQTAKRDTWGRKHQRGTAGGGLDSTCRRRTLRIVTEDDWAAAHARLAAARAIYFTATGGQTFGRPALGNPVEVPADESGAVRTAAAGRSRCDRGRTARAQAVLWLLGVSRARAHGLRQQRRRADGGRRRHRDRGAAR